ncbi:hypothetical protein BO70DRAFT_255339, partial [Aspergillus heteromorphus CBS 117.55]
PGEEEPEEWPNMNALFAHEGSTHIRRHYPDFAIWTMRDAFEERPEPGDSSFEGMKDQHIIAAAQYILWDGQELFKHIICPDPHQDMQGWQPGLLYFGDHSFSLQGWQFWKKWFQ